MHLTLGGHNRLRSMAAVASFITSALFWSLVPLVLSSSEADPFGWAGVFFVFQGAFMGVFARAFGLKLSSVWRALMQLRRDDRGKPTGRRICLLIAGEAQIPLFKWSAALVGAASATAIYELWVIALVVFLAAGGRGLGVPKGRFGTAAVVCAVGVGLVAIGRGVSIGGGAIAVVAGIFLGVMSAVLAGGFTAASIHLSGYRRYISTADRRGGVQTEAVASFLLVGFAGLCCAPIFLTAGVMRSSLVEIVTWPVMWTAAVCGACSVGSTYFMRLGAVLAKGSAVSLWLNMNMVFSMAWLVGFGRVELSNAVAFWCGSSLILLGASAVRGLSRKGAVRESG